MIHSARNEILDASANPAKNTYERGEMAHTPPDAIYLHTTSPEQFAPKR